MSRKYKVWVSQVNASIVYVSAESEEDARDKAYRKWRKEEAHSYISYIEELGNDFKD